MDVKFIFMFTLFVQTYCDHEHNELESILVKRLTAMTGKENFVEENTNWVYVGKAETDRKKPSSLKSSGYDHLKVKVISNRRRNIRKRNVTQVGVNCPLGYARPQNGKKCYRTQDSKS
ncbi:uncharacterized protein LOC108912274 [Anoplophora glabripennis]|uniref:uncharacterized protein LOC108912274 n=1 Tax=Anoplophora glabripennis TaxID=217634 RepID=UPI0008758F75|nr:uncharacterized protein LOC108912274 [Anoplophora glabripennis]